MNRFAVALTAITVLLGVLSASALASSTTTASPSTSNAGATEYNQKETVPVSHEKGDSRVEGTNANSGNSGSGNSGSSGGDISSTSSAGSSSGVAGLPFTGLDVFALAAIGALLVGAGFAQRRFVAGRQA
jgi:hypothetical protein